jgi:hypothetical protein
MWIIYEEYMKMRQKELLDEAERYRMTSKVKSFHGRPQPNYARVMSWTGSLMLKLGTWLTIRFGDKTVIAQSGVVDNHLQGTH